MRIVFADAGTRSFQPSYAGGGALRARAELGFAVFPHPLDDGAALGVDRLPSRRGVVRHRLDDVDRRLRRLELLPVLDDGPRLLEAPAQLFGAWIDRLEVDPTGWPAPDRAPQRRERHGDSSGQEGEAAVHRLDDGIRSHIWAREIVGSAISGTMLHWPPLPAPLPRSVAV